MATLERREQTPGNVTYRVRWWADGRQRSKSFKVHADARRWKAVLEGDLVNGSYLDPKSGLVTLSAFVTEHVSALTVDLRPSTAVRVQGVIDNHIVPTFGHLPLTAVTSPMVAAWVQNMGTHLSPASVRKNAGVLSRVLDLAISYGLLRANSVAPVRLPAEPRHEQRYLDHAQVWTLADSIVPRFRAMVLLAVFGGLRAGEIAALRRSCVVPERNVVVVRETLVDVKGHSSFGPPKTKSSVRTVTLPRSIMGELVAHMDAYTGSAPDALVFTGERGVTVRRSWFYRYYWQPATTKAGMSGLRFHDLRHTFVALWVSLGRNPKEVSRAAGHSSVAFTLDRYGHLYDADADGLADELDVMLGHARTQDPSSWPTDVRRAGVRQHDAAQVKPFHGGSTGSNPVGGASGNERVSDDGNDGPRTQ